MSNPVTYGVIAGVLETMLMGQAAESEAAKKKKEAEDAAGVKATDNLMTALQDPVAARAFWYEKDVNEGLGNIYNGLNEANRAAIWSYAQRDLPVPAYDKNVLTEINDAETARAAIGDAQFMATLQPETRRLINSMASVPITAAERDILGTFTGTPQEQIVKIESFYNMYGEDTGFGKVLRNRAKSLAGIKVAPEYKPVDEDGMRDLLKSSVEEDAGPNARVNALAQLAKAKNYIEPFIFGKDIEESQDPTGETVLPDYLPAASPQAVQDYILISMMEATYATRDGGVDDENDFVKLFTNSLELLNKLSETTNDAERLEYAAAQQIDVFESAGFDPENATTEELALFEQIKSLAKDYDTVDKNRVVFGAGTENEIALDDPKANPLKALMMLNENAERVEKLYNGLEGDEKLKFEREVTGLLFLDNRQTGTTTTRQGGVSETIPETNFIDVLPALYEKLDFVKKFIHDELMYPRPGETSNGLKTVSVPQLQDDGVTPLAPDFFRVSGSVVLEATPAVKALAAANGKTPQNYLLTDSIAYGMIVGGSNDPFSLFEAAKGLNDSNMFRKDKGLRNSQHAPFAMTFVSRGITDRVDQLDIISSVMPTDIPRNFKPVFGQRGITKQQLNELMEFLTGRKINLEDVAKSKENSTSFLEIADEVAYLIGQAEPGSQAYKDLAATMLNLFGTDTAFVKQTFTGALVNVKDFLGFADNEALFREQDMLVLDGQNAADVRDSVMARAEVFMKDRFLANNAQLKSALVTLAYNYAKTMDPSGRISERDFQAALEAVSAGAFDSKETRLAVVNRLINNAEDNVAFHGRIFDVSSKMKGNVRVYNITNDDIRNMRALRHFSTLKRVTRGMEIVEIHQQIVEQGGSDYIMDDNWNAMFVPDPAAAVNEFGADVAMDNGIAGLKIRSGRTGSVHPMGSGIPVYYFTATGQVLTPRQIRQLKGTGGV